MMNFYKIMSLTLVLSSFFLSTIVQGQSSTTPKTSKKKVTVKRAAPKRPTPRLKVVARSRPTPPQVAAKVKAPQLTDKHRFSLVTIEEKVNTLKEKVFRSKAQLLLLQETLLHGTISTARLKLIQENKMGSTFYLESAAYTLNGTPIFSRSDHNGSLNNKRKLILYQGSIRPGPCRLSIQLRFRGNGFGLFSYLRHYRFRIRSSLSYNI